MYTSLKTFGLLALLFCMFSCSSSPSNDYPDLSEEDKIKIEEFSLELTNSLKERRYDVMRNSWSNALFYKSLGQLSKIQTNYYRHQIDNVFGGLIKSGHLDLINTLKYSNGSVSSYSVNFTENWGEINYVLKFDKNLKFVKYKAVVHEGKVRLVDCFDDFMDDWQSNILKNILEVLVPKRQQTKEREQAIRAIMQVEQMRMNGELDKALEILYLIPEDYRMNHNVSNYAMFLAANANINEFKKVVKWEKDKRSYIYVDYWHGVLFDHPEELSKVIDELKIKYHTNDPIVDSLKTKEYAW